MLCPTGEKKNSTGLFLCFCALEALPFSINIEVQGLSFVSLDNIARNVTG